MKPAIVATLLFITTSVCIAQQPSPRYEVTIEAYVDGPSSLRFTANGFYWRNGYAAKPGRHDAHNYPTYVNGKEWMPKWGKSNTDRGEDKSDVFPWNPGSLDLSFELLAVAKERGETRIEKRTPIEVRREGSEFAIHIFDKDSGSRWYKFIVRAPDPFKPRLSATPAASPK